MDDEYVEEPEAGEEESGGSLRRKLESEIAAKKELMNELAALKAKAVISEKGFDLVNPEDLKGVAPAEVEARAEALQQERLEVAQRYLGNVLGIQDVDGDVAEALKGLIGKDGKPSAEGLSRARELNSISGDPVSRRDPHEGATGPARIRAAFGA